MQFSESLLFRYNNKSVNLDQPYSLVCRWIRSGELRVKFNYYNIVVHGANIIVYYVLQLCIIYLYVIYVPCLDANLSTYNMYNIITTLYCPKYMHIMLQYSVAYYTMLRLTAAACRSLCRMCDNKNVEGRRRWWK